MSEQIVNTKRDKTAQLDVVNADGVVETIQLNPQGRTDLPEGWYVTEDSMKRCPFVHVPSAYKQPKKQAEPQPTSSKTYK